MQLTVKEFVCQLVIKRNEVFDMENDELTKEQDSETIVVPNDCVLSIYAVNNGINVTYAFDYNDVRKVFVVSEKCRLMLSHILLKFEEDKRLIKFGIRNGNIITVFELEGENILELLDALFTCEYTRIERGLGV